MYKTISVKLIDFPDLIRVIKSCKIKHGPFRRHSWVYHIPIKKEQDVTVLLLTLSEKDIKIVQ